MQMMNRTMTALACMTLAGAALGQQDQLEVRDGAGQIMARQAGSTVAQAEIDRANPVWHEAKNEGQLRRAHPPLHLIPPMPMPESLPVIQGKHAGQAATDPGIALTHDGATGEMGVFDGGVLRDAISQVAPGFTSGEGNLLSEFDAVQNARAFGSMSTIAGVGSDPWRRNVKVVMRFVDQGGVDRFFVCSGTMSDAETVLTAGHCVYARTPNGLVINDWAQEFWIYPGWDGVGVTADQARIIETHGIGYGTFSGAFTGWTQNGNFDWDAGVIRINRAVGMLTGWFGWAWGADCGVIQGRTYHNASYPAENCGGSLHNGRDMYYWFGSIDSCPGNQMQINTTTGCTTAMWGGQSGSGVYYIDNGNRIVHGVASNSNRSTSGRYAKLWESFVTFMNDFEDDSRGSNFDAQVLRSRYVQSSVTAGDSITGNQYFVTNPTNANPASQTFSMTHRLSTNALISSGDVNIGGETFTYDFGAMSSVNVNNGGNTYTIPYNTPSGTYYVGALMATGSGGDSTSSNNDASYWDAQELTVNGLADVQADSVLASPLTVDVGDAINVTMNYSNIGGDSSNAVTVDLRLSTNDLITTFDTALGNRNYPGMSGNSSSSRNTNVIIPADLTPGRYYVGMIVTSSDDAGSTNNAVADTLQIDVIGPWLCADQNQDGLVTPADFNSWIINYNMNSPIADVNRDGIVSPADFNAWIGAFNAGLSGPTCNP